MFHDLRATARPIQRQFDRHDIRVVRGFDHEPLHRGLEGIVGMVDQDIPLREDREDGATLLEGRAALMRRVVQIGERQARQLTHATKVEEAVGRVQIRRPRGAARGGFLELQLAQ